MGYFSGFNALMHRVIPRNWGPHMTALMSKVHYNLKFWIKDLMARADGPTGLFIAGFLLRFWKGGIRSREGYGHRSLEPLKGHLNRFEWCSNLLRGLFGNGRVGQVYYRQ
jgi:hypothetical protein